MVRRSEVPEQGGGASEGVGAGSGAGSEQVPNRFWSKFWRGCGSGFWRGSGPVLEQVSETLRGGFGAKFRSVPEFRSKVPERFSGLELARASFPSLVPLARARVRAEPEVLGYRA